MIAEPLKVLVVDDEIIIARNLQNTLLEIGYEVPSVACTAEEALEAVKTSPPDIIFMDIRLGDSIDGIDVAEQIKKYCDIPIIFLTAFADEDTISRAKEVAPYGYLVKPVSERDIRLILDVALGRYRAEVKLKILTQEILRINQSLDSKVEEKTRELREKNADLEQFVFAIAHDLQEPARVIANFTDLIKSDCPQSVADATALQYLTVIEKSAYRIGSLISSILIFSRTSHVPIEMETLSVLDVFNELLFQSVESIKESSATISCGHLPIIQANPDMLSIVLKNLLENSLKYRTPAPPKIHLTCQLSGKFWLFTFRDNGIGFDQSQANKIFGLFKRLHSESKYPGSGLGLALCKKIIERHGGEMWACSSIGQGSEFHFTLPAQEK